MTAFPQGPKAVQATYYSSPNGLGQGGGKIMPRRPNFATSFAQRLPADVPIASNSAAVVAQFIEGNTVYSSGCAVNYSNINSGATSYSGNAYGGYPIWMVDATTPLVTVSGGPHAPTFPSDNGISHAPIPAAATTFTAGALESSNDQGNISMYGYQRYTVSGGSYTAPTADWPLIVWQVDTGQVWEFWQALPASTVNTPTGWYASYGGTFGGPAAHGGALATHDGRLTAGDGGGDAATGISYLATLVTQADILSGSIDHMVACAVWNGDGINNGATPLPAMSGKTDTSGSGLVSEGMIFRFPAASSCPSGFCTFAQLLYNAIRDYGLVIVDSAGENVIECQDGFSWAVQLLGLQNDTPAQLAANSTLLSLQAANPIYEAIVGSTAGPNPASNYYSPLANQNFWNGLELVAAPTAWPPTWT